MPRQVRLSDEAAADLDAVYRWQVQPGAGPTALRRLRIIAAAIRRLHRNPCLYGKGEKPATREFSVEGHRIVYAVRPDTNNNATAGDVTVLRVFGPGQNRKS